MKKILTTYAALLLVVGLWAQSSHNFWQDVPVGQMSLPEDTDLEFTLTAARTLSLDLNDLGDYLQAAPMEGTAAADSAPLLLELPMPDGTLEQFAVWESPVLEPGLAAKFPSIRTFAGKSLTTPGSYLRLGHMPTGFHANIHWGDQTVLITPYVAGQTEFYKSYSLKNVQLNPQTDQFACGVTTSSLDLDKLLGEKNGDDHGRSANVPINLYRYRLAVATTVEYSNSNGNTPASVLSAVATVVNNVNMVYKAAVGIELVLVDNTSDVFFFGAFGSDPYTNGQTDVMIDENPPVLNGTIGVANYDIGHVFGTNAGGLAQTGSVCGASKARGVSCTFGAFAGELFFIIASHEIGHQFNALHNFNLCDGDNESPPTGYEPGAGSTIMCYSGASNCTGQWLQPAGDPYFHLNAMERIRAFSRNGATGGGCAEIITVGNETPEVSVPLGDGMFIPISTPFELTGEANDLEGDPMTYTWEQYDLGPPSTLGMPIGSAPLFRSFLPIPSPTRVFPRIDRVVGNISHPHEVLPTTSRVLTFRFTARDNNSEAGGYTFEEIQFNATETAGPFLVEFPNAGTEVLEVGQYVEVKWDVANTDDAPVNCQIVNIRLSTDGGFTYPITLLANTLNDGSAFVTIPNAVSDLARVRVEAADNIFFDISNNNFSIVPPAEPGFALVSEPELGIACTPEVFEVDLQTAALLGFAENITFSVTGLPLGAVPTFSTNPVTPGDATTLSIDLADVTVDGDYTATITAVANGVPDAVRTVMLNVVYNDFSAMQLLQPTGSSGNSTLPSFTWTGLPNALLYNIQISDTPDFSNIIDEATNLLDPDYSPAVELSENTVYYWRIASINECGTGDWSNTAAFKTVSQSCNITTKSDEQTISATGLPLIQSVINIPAGGTISDVNVRNIQGNHDQFRHLKFSLKGPDGTTVVMTEGVLTCGSASGFNFGFNDQAPSGMIPCPPNGGLMYQPQNLLSEFNGKDSQGDWTLAVEVTNTLGAGGDFVGWALEICGAFQGQDPFLVTNEVLPVPPNDSRLIYSDKLVVDDPDNLPAQLQFTIVNDVQHGFLSRGGTQLGQGDHFTMMDIYSSQVTYTNTNGAAEADYFTFSVDDGNGGFFGTPVFNIVIDVDAPPSAAGEVLPSANVLVYPNPTTGLLNIEFLEAVPGEVTASVLNVQGQVLLLRKVDAAAGKFQLNLNELPAGMHLLQLATSKGIFVKKIVVE